MSILENETIVVFSNFFSELASRAKERDLEGHLDSQDRAALKASGLLSSLLFESPSSVAHVIRRLASSDAAIAQLLATSVSAHTYLRDLFGVDDGSHWLALVEAEAAFSAIAAPHHATITTDGLLVRGSASIVPGGAAADRFVIAIAYNHGKAAAVIDRETPGLTVSVNAPTFGQRAAQSATLVLDDVLIQHADVLRDIASNDARDRWLLYDEVLRNAVDLGTLEGFVDAAQQFLLTRARPWHESGAETASTDPHTIATFGQAFAQLNAARRLFEVSVPDPQGLMSVDRVGIARAYVARRGPTLINSVIGTLGASSTSSSIGLDRYWRDLRTHLLRQPPRWTVAESVLQDRKWIVERREAYADVS